MQSISAVPSCGISGGRLLFEGLFGGTDSMIGAYVRGMNGHIPPSREATAKVLADYSGLTEEEAGYIAEGFRVLVHRHRIAFITSTIDRICAQRGVVPEVLGEPAEGEMVALPAQEALLQRALRPARLASLA